MLTWWGVSLAILERQDLGNAVASREVLLRAVPVFVAVLVWLIRVLIIGTFSVAGDRLFSSDEQRPYIPARTAGRTVSIPAPAATVNNRAPAYRSASAGSSNRRSASMSSASPYETSYVEKPEPTYHSISASPAASQNRGATPSTPSFNRSDGNYRR
jgi:hypothetical protein